MARWGFDGQDPEPSKLATPADKLAAAKWHRDDVCERRDECRANRSGCSCERTVSLFRKLCGN